MYILAAKAYMPGILSKLALTGKMPLELEWAKGVDYVGSPCRAGGHSTMGMTRDGKLAGMFKSRAKYDLGFFRNGCFEVVVREDLAEKIQRSFPKVEFAEANITGGQTDDWKFFELVSPMVTQIDFEKSGYELGEPCKVCGFVSRTRVEKLNPRAYQSRRLDGEWSKLSHFHIGRVRRFSARDVKCFVRSFQARRLLSASIAISARFSFTSK